MSKAAYLNALNLRLAERLAEAEGYSLRILQGKARCASISRARASVAWELARETGMSFPEIGALLCKDHTSVLHMIRAENERRCANVRGLQFPQGYRERNRRSAALYALLSREVVA